MKKPKLTHDSSQIEFSSCIACKHYKNEGLFKSATCTLTTKPTTIECDQWAYDEKKEEHYKKGWTLTI